MEKRFDVVVVGELNPDLILSGDVEPAFGQVEKLVDRAELVIGSSAAIFACGASRLGLRMAFAGIAGDDVFGRFMLGSMQEKGVDTSGIRLDPDLHTGLSVILSKESDRSILTYPGAIPALRYEDLDLGLLQKARHLHLSSYYLLDRLRPDVPRLFAEAGRRGLTISVDTNFDPAGEWDGGIREALSHADIFLPNETELLAISRAGSVDEGLERVAGWGPLVAVKQGSRGAAALVQGEKTQAGSILVEVADSVGAGDSFDAGFIYGWLQHRGEWPLERILRLACICGALSTRQPGGTSAQPSIEEAESYLNGFADSTSKETDR